MPKGATGMKQIILGTAGHIDHGKTALIKALTGIDTDRLKEEKERGAPPIAERTGAGDRGRARPRKIRQEHGCRRYGH